MTPLEHADAHERLADLALEPGALNRIGSPESDPLGAHLASCETCRRDVEAWQRTHARLEEPGLRPAPGIDVAAAGLAGGDVRTERVRARGPQPVQGARLEGQVGEALVGVGVFKRGHRSRSAGRAAPAPAGEPGRRSGTSASRARRRASARRVRDFTVPIGMPSRAAISDWLRAWS